MHQKKATITYEVSHLYRNYADMDIEETDDEIVFVVGLTSLDGTAAVCLWQAVNDRARSRLFI